MKQQRGLGKGLGALLGEIEENEGVVELDLNLIDPNRSQARKKFDEESIRELARSIKTYGVVQPILVNYSQGRYTIIAGERRWRASRMAGLSSIPAIVKNLDEREVMEISLVENLQREDLNPAEEAEGMKQLMEVYDMTQEELAERIGKSRPHITNTLRLLKLHAPVLDMLRNGVISAGHARCLVSLEDEQKQLAFAQAVEKDELSVRQLEAMIKREKTEKTTKSAPAERKPLPIELREAETQMRETIGTKVTLVGNAQRGKLIVEYYSPDDLQRIVDRLSLVAVRD